MTVIDTVTCDGDEYEVYRTDDGDIDIRESFDSIKSDVFETARGTGDYIQEVDVNWPTYNDAAQRTESKWGVVCVTPQLLVEFAKRVEDEYDGTEGVYLTAANNLPLIADVGDKEIALAPRSDRR